MLKELRHAHRYTYSRFWTGKPVILTHSLTSICNCKCKICNVWRKENTSYEMKTHQIIKLLDDARRLNFAAYLLWGGEPLMRRDTIDLLRYAHDTGFYTSLITNGTKLLENVRDIADTVNLVWVSLDHYSKYHDEMRGLSGVFDKAIKGIIGLKRLGGRIVINCVLSRMNLDVVSKMVELADQLGVRVAFDPMEVFPGVNEEYALSTKELHTLFLQIREYKKAGYPILNSYGFIDHLINPGMYSCAHPKVFTCVSEDGKITPFWCRMNNEVLGDLLKQNLSEILYSDRYSEFIKVAESCSLCRNSSTVEASMFYSVRTSLINCFKMENPIIRFLQDYAL